MQRAGADQLAAVTLEESVNIVGNLGGRNRSGEKDVHLTLSTDRQGYD